MPPRPKLPSDAIPDKETLSFEEEVLRRTVGPVSAALVELIRTILATFAFIPEGAGDALTDAQAKAVGAAIAGAIKRFSWDPMNRQIANAALEAHRLGVRRAAERFEGEKKRKAAATRTPRKRSTPNTDKALRTALREAQRLAAQGVRTRTDATAVAAKVSSGKARIEGHARSVANEGINAGTLDVAKTMRLRVMWVAERNACLHCLAHAGWVVEPGDLFPPVSFDPNARSVVAVATCPLHPNCRCQLRCTDEPAGKPPADRSSLSPAARLAAEARRSVVYQWTEYASSPAMERAARTLLSAGAGLPASVEKRARSMLRKKK